MWCSNRTTGQDARVCVISAVFGAERTDREKVKAATDWRTRSIATASRVVRVARRRAARTVRDRRRAHRAPATLRSHYDHVCVCDRCIYTHATQTHIHTRAWCAKKRQHRARARSRTQTSCRKNASRVSRAFSRAADDDDLGCVTLVCVFVLVGLCY